MNQKEKLIELVDGLSIETHDDVIGVVDWLLANGVVVLPCRCGECEYHDPDGDIGYCYYRRIYTRMGDYCNHAKRKGGDER